VNTAINMMQWVHNAQITDIGICLYDTTQYGNNGMEIYGN